MMPGSWYVSCADWRSFVLTVGVPCLLCSLALPGIWGFLRVAPVDSESCGNYKWVLQRGLQAHPNEIAAAHYCISVM